MSTLDAMFEQFTSASVRAAFGHPSNSVSSSASEVAWATVLGGVGGAIGTSVAGATATARMHWARPMRRS
jgi:hypothetical protein